uniref:Uncharacterized protein n=1 Tax=Vitrella brassicaformis TaxID=1169539 RepID=A0A7S1PER8_9ALVE
MQKQGGCRLYVLHIHTNRTHHPSIHGECHVRLAISVCTIGGAIAMPLSLSLAPSLTRQLVVCTGDRAIRLSDEWTNALEAIHGPCCSTVHPLSPPGPPLSHHPKCYGIDTHTRLSIHPSIHPSIGPFLGSLGQSVHWCSCSRDRSMPCAICSC